MKQVSDIMIRNLITLKPTSNLKDVEAMMASRQIRHIPVTDDDQKLLGLITQKEFLAEAFRITDKFGAHQLAQYLTQTQLSDCMKTTLTTVHPETDLREAGESLHSMKQGCLLVVDEDGILQGILTSQDFVKLALDLLPHQ
ncbi:HPP family protein [Bacterioplanoides sp.]|uniref:CBS domain-containing protein n=1 Tax=Bacterioplanoides sp. TaxID=2066072 RepID=UPI003B5993FC